LFIAATLYSKNQQNTNRFVVLCQKQALISKKVFVYKKNNKKIKRKKYRKKKKIDKNVFSTLTLPLLIGLMA